MTKIILSIFAFFTAALAFAQDTLPPGGVVVPGVDPLEALIALIQNWKAGGPLAAGMILVSIAVQLLKKWPDFKYNRVAVTLFSIIYAVLFHVVAGSTLLSAVIVALVSGGGAVALYEAIKGIMTPIKAVLGK